MSSSKYPPPPSGIDPSKVVVRVGNTTLKPPVHVGVGGYTPGAPPTPGVDYSEDAFGPVPAYDQPVPQQFKNFNVPISADAFTALIQNQSPNVLWEKGTICPARQENGEHDPNCDICVFGVLYYDPKKVSMLVTSSSLQQNFYMQGRYDSGSINVTSVAANPISYGDRISIVNNQIRDSELRRRTMKTLVDPLKYKALCGLKSFVRTKERQYNEGSDYTITEEGTVQWTPNKSARPADGAFYSIVYYHHPVYIITDMVHHHRDRRLRAGTPSDQAVVLPIQGIAKLDFLVRKESKDAPETEFNSPFAGPQSSG